MQAARSGQPSGSARSNASVADTAASTAERATPLYLSSQVTAAMSTSMSQDFAAPLARWAILSVTGPDAAAFLHAQFTNDVEALAPGHAQWNGWCSPKGRLLASFLLVRHAAGFFLLLPADIAPAI